MRCLDSSAPSTQPRRESCHERPELHDAAERESHEPAAFSPIEWERSVLAYRCKVDHACQSVNSLQQQRSRKQTLPPSESSSTPCHEPVSAMRNPGGEPEIPPPELSVRNSTGTSPSAMWATRCPPASYYRGAAGHTHVVSSTSSSRNAGELRSRNAIKVTMRIAPEVAHRQ